MVTSDFSTIISSLEFDTTNGSYPTIVHIEDNNYAIAYEGASQQGWLATVSIGIDGSIGSVIDTYNFAASCFNPNILKVAAGIYAIGYRASPAADSRVITIAIASNGIITQSVIDSLAYGSPTTASYIHMICITANIFAISYQQGSTGYVRTFTIDSAGDIGTVIDTLTSTTANARGRLLQVSGTMYVRVSWNSSYGVGLETFSIDSTGDIGVVVDTLTISGSSTIQCFPFITHISGNIFAVIYRTPAGGAEITTINIDSSGNIADSVVATLSPVISSTTWLPIYSLGGTEYVIVCNTTSDQGLAKTITISNDGTALIIRSSLIFDTVSGLTPFLLYLPESDGVYVVAYEGANGDGFLATFEILAESTRFIGTSRSLLRHRIAIALGDMLVPIGSRPTYIANTALIDTFNLRHADNDTLNGAEIYIYASTASAQGQSRWVEDYIASSSLVTVAAWTITPGIHDNYEMHKRFRVKEYDEAIDAAHDVVRLQHLLSKVDESIILNNVVSNGLMATWANITSMTEWSGAARTGVAGSALTVTQESNTIYSRYYSAKLTSPADTTQTSAFYDVISDFSKYAGRTIEVRTWVHCLTANRVRAFIQEGTGTPKYSSYHNGKGWNDSDDLYASTTLSDNLSGLTVGIAIAAGSQIDAYLGRLEAIAGRKIYEYDIPSGFVAIDKVEVESSIHNVYNPISSNKDWEIIRDATKRLHIFNPIAKRGISIQGHGVRICGQRKATKPTADTDSVELNEKFVIAYACWYLLQRNLQPNEVGILNEWKRKADELRHKLTVSMQGKLVESVG